MIVERLHRSLRLVRARTLALLVACCSLALALGDLSGTPYAGVATTLLEHLHAEVTPCGVALDSGVLCFVVEPAQAASVAEAIEAYIAERSAELKRDDWHSANGVHTVTLILRDDPWGGLRLWLSEPSQVKVEGRLEYLPKRR